MKNETRDADRKIPSSAQGTCHFIWPVSKSPVPDGMTKSYDPCLDIDRWNSILESE